MNVLPESAANGIDAAPVGRPPVPPPGPIAQSVSIGFRSVYIAAALVALIWLTSNIREIAPDSQAVVYRFGRIVRSQEAGLMIAWPRPIEQVQLLPGPQRQLVKVVDALQPPTEESAALIGAPAHSSVPMNSEAYLTADGNVVLVAATLVYHVNNPIAYAVEERHVQPALGRLFRTVAVHVAAHHNLNDFLVVPSLQQATVGLGTGEGRQSLEEQRMMAQRTAVRDELLSTLNARLRELAAAGTPLGVNVDRIDITPSLPPEATKAFNAVLVAAQAAASTVATARTDAERRRQSGVELRQQLLASAQATAKEMVSNAGVATAPILALEQKETPFTRSTLLLQQYRTDVSAILKAAGKVTLVNSNTGARFLLPGNQK